MSARAAGVVAFVVGFALMAIAARVEAQVVVAGDSLAVGTVPHLRGELRMVVDADAEVSRRAGPSVDALERLAKARPRYRVAVLDAGTNDWSAGMVREALLRARRLVKPRPLVVASVRGPEGEAKTEAIRRFAARRRCVWMVRWVERGPGVLAPDGLHGSPWGYEVRGRMFARVVRRAARSAECPVVRWWDEG